MVGRRVGGGSGNETTELDGWFVVKDLCEDIGEEEDTINGNGIKRLVFSTNFWIDHE